MPRRVDLLFTPASAALHRVIGPYLLFPSGGLIFPGASFPSRASSFRETFLRKEKVNHTRHIHARLATVHQTRACVAKCPTDSLMSPKPLSRSRCRAAAASARAGARGRSSPPACEAPAARQASGAVRSGGSAASDCPSISLCPGPSFHGNLARASLYPSLPRQNT